MKSKIFILLTMFIFFISCEEKNKEVFSSFFSEINEGEKNDAIIANINGIWENISIRININGANGTVTEMYWDRYLEHNGLGQIKIGDVFIKDILKQDHLKWSCYSLVSYKSGATLELKWYPAFIIMAPDGKTINLDFKNSNISNATFTKQNINESAYSIPVLKEVTFSNLTPNSITVSSEVLSDGGMPVKGRGVCWSKTPNPTMDIDNLKSGEGIGNFSVLITGLVANTKYYARSYALNAKGVGYGLETTFTTQSIDMPNITFGSVSNISYNDATASATISTLGNSPIVEYGHCWNTMPQPTISNNKSVSTSNNTTAFTSNITGLTQNTKYYVRAYVTTNNGTTYSDESNFTTQVVVAPTLTIGSVNSITHNSAKVTGGITNAGSLAIIEAGHCWSKSTQPTIQNEKIAANNGLSSFVCDMMGLTPNTVYYVRTYATTANGTNYSSERTFKTGTDPYTVSNGLLAFYNFDAQNCNDVVAANNAVANSGISFSNITASNSGYSVKFDGASGFLNIPKQILPSTNVWSVNLWVNSNVKNNFRLLTFGSTYQFISINTWSNLLVSFSYVYKSLFSNDLSTKLFNGSWHMLTITLNGQNIKYYVDGSLQETKTIDTNYKFESHSNTIIGSNSSPFFSGYMDNIRFYNKALSESEIQILYNAKQ